MERTAAEIRWSALVAAQLRSGEPIAAWCAARGLNPRTLSWWKWRLAQTDHGEAGSAFVELVIADPPREPQANPTGLALTLANWPATLHVAPTTDLVLLRRVLEALC